MWFEEHIGENEKRAYRVVDLLYRDRSDFQEIEIFRLANQGITLVLDGHARVFELDEHIYHEAITYPALCRHPRAASALVIGDGDGGIIRELLKLNNLKIDWVEIDHKVIEACEKHLPSFPRNYGETNRVQLIIEDGWNYLQRCHGKYDLVFVSVTAEGESSCADVLYKHNVFKEVKRVLHPDGIAVFSIAEFSCHSVADYRRQIRVANQFFKCVKPFYVALPSYGTNWGFALTCDLERPYQQNQSDGLQDYSEAEDAELFRVPKYFRE